MTVLVAQLGARRHYAVPRALHAVGQLERLVTDACAEIWPWRLLEASLPARLRPAGLRRLLGRRVVGVPPERIRGLPLFTLSASWDRGQGQALIDFWARRNARFATLVASAGFGAADAVYAYNGAALEILRTAHAMGLRTVLDQTAAPWRWNASLLAEEAKRWPGWEDQTAELDAAGQLAEREEAEWTLADRIICGSDFAADAVAEIGGPRQRCVVVPYPVPPTPVRSVSGGGRRTRHGEPLRVLFVGTLQLRKGVPYLLEAQRRLNSEGVRTRLVGPSLLSERVMRDLRREMEVIGAVPRGEMGEHYDWADVLVLPTLSEGSANVVYEARAAGLAVITTPNAGSDIRDGETGLLIPIRDADALAGALRRFAESEELRERLGPIGEGDSPAGSAQRYAAALMRAVGMQ